MSEAIQQIAERLRGLRDVLEISVEEMAEVCHLTPEEYLRLESGTADISIDMLHTIARKYGVEPITLMFGDEPKMSTYFVTRSGRGASVERTKAYKYQSLAAGFLSRRADPFMVTVHPKPEGTPIFLNRHTGQEYNYVVRGRMLLQINGKDLILEAGDSKHLLQLRSASRYEGTRRRRGAFLGHHHCMIIPRLISHFLI